jgi:RNA recognition motif-containing protein
MNIYVANIGGQIQNEDLRNLFAAYGDVHSAEIAMDAFTDKPRGFAYVEMPEQEQAQAAISALNKKEFSGSVLEVREAAPREVRKGSYKVGTGPHYPMYTKRRR